MQQSFAEDGVNELLIEGSVDGTTFVTLVDRVAGRAGRTYGAAVTGAFRYVKLTIGWRAGGRQPGARGEWDSSRYRSALGQPAAATTEQVSYEGKSAVDGNTSSVLGREHAALPQYFTVNLGQSSELTRVEQAFVDDDTYGFVIEGSNDNRRSRRSSTIRWVLPVSCSPEPVSGRYLYGSASCDFVGRRSNWAGSQRFRVFGAADSRARCHGQIRRPRAAR